MKETIYTIPINEALEQESECPLCYLEKKLEAEAVEYALGPAMMEPDHRMISNEKGYCNKHFDMLYATPNKLPLALVLDTHLENIRKKVSEMKSIDVKKGLFKSKPKDKPTLEPMLNSCMICDSIAHTMDRYYAVLIQMWEKEPDFKARLEASKGFCLPHFEKLYAISDNAEFLKALVLKEEQQLELLQQDVHKFTLKFDYRNKDMEWGTAKDSPVRAVERIAGYITGRE